MKKSSLIVLFTLAICVTTNPVSAQKRSRASSGATYKTALGLGVDFGDGSSFIGPSIKHFFTKNNVGKAEILFTGYATMLSLYYQYHGDIENATGLKYTLGLGGSAQLYNDNRIFYRNRNADFAFRPTAGLDFKIPNVPIEIEFDWRPAFYVTNNTDIDAGRFGFGFRYCFN